LAAAGALDVPVVDVGRTDYTDAELRGMFLQALEHHEPVDGSALDESVIAGVDLSYVSGDSATPRRPRRTAESSRCSETFDEAIKTVKAALEAKDMEMPADIIALQATPSLQPRCKVVPTSPRVGQ
jgi:hypothetical protein